MSHHLGRDNWVWSKGRSPLVVERNRCETQENDLGASWCFLDHSWPWMDKSSDASLRILGSPKIPQEMRVCLRKVTRISGGKSWEWRDSGWMMKGREEQQWPSWGQQQWLGLQLDPQAPTSMFPLTESPTGLVEETLLTDVWKSKSMQCRDALWPSLRCAIQTPIQERIHCRDEVCWQLPAQCL